MSLFANLDVAKLASQLGNFSIPDDPEIQQHHGPRDFGYTNHGYRGDGYEGRPPSGYAGGPQNGADEYKRGHPSAWGSSDPDRSASVAAYPSAYDYDYKHGAQQQQHHDAPPYPSSDSPRPDSNRYGDQSAPYPTDSPGPYQQHQQHQQQRYNDSSPSPYSHPPPPDTETLGGYGGRPVSPRLPEGWTKRLDPSSGRWYYVNQATGSSQWVPPLPAPTPPGVGSPSPGYGYGHAERYGAHSPQHAGGYGGQHSPRPGPGYGEHAAAAAAGGATGAAAGYYAGQQYEQSHHQYQSHQSFGEPQREHYGQPSYHHQQQQSGYEQQQQQQHYGQQQSYGQTYEHGYAGEDKRKKKKSGSGNMLLGVAGGLAVGAIGGALIANALDSDSDGEHERRDYRSSSGSEDDHGSDRGSEGDYGEDDLYYDD